MQDLRRAREILNVGAKYGFLIDPAFTAKVPGLGMLTPNPEISALSRGERAKRVLEELGPTFVKLGQVLSIRADLVPGDIVDSLRQLQKDVAPLPASELEDVIAGYLGSPIEEHFASFDLEPMAAASIAQVHRARLKVGEETHDVVVKVQRPGIREKMESDLSILYWLARLAEGSIAEAALYQPVAVVREFEAALFQELDFLHEARNIQEVTRNFEKRPGLLELPRVYENLTSQKLLVMSFVEGIRITDIVGKPQYDPEQLLQRALEVIFEMVFEDGFFHGDPHPGNVLVTSDSRIAMLDFGLMGRLSKEEQETLIQLALAVFARNASQLTRVVMKMGQVPQTFNRLAFEGDVKRLMDQYLGVELANLNSQNLIRDCMEMIVNHHVRLPPEYAILGRAAGTIEGIGRIIYPEFNVIKVAAPFVTKLVARRLEPAKLGTEAMGLALQVQQLLTEAPVQAGRLLDDLEAGRLQVGVRGPALDELLAMQRVHSLRMVVVASAGALTLAAAVTIAPFHYTLSSLGITRWNIPLVPLVCMVIVSGMIGFLWLTYLFPQGPKKLSLKSMTFWRRR
ncbi:MAG: ABC1 kinase family protein [Polyangiales bacterium]